MSDKTKSSLFRNWRFWVAVVLLPIVGFAAWRGGVTVYDLFLNWRSERLAIQASDLFGAGKSAESRAIAAKSLDCNPANPDSLRLLAKIQIASGEDSAALGTYKKLSATRAFTAADVENYARLAGRLKEWEVADRLVKALRAGPKSVQAPILESELAVMRGDSPRAEACLREAVGIDSTPQSWILLTDFLISNRLDLQTTPEVYELLVQTNRLQTPAGAQMLATALEKNLAPPAEAPRWIQELRAHPNRTAAMLLAADTAEVRRDPVAKSQVAEGLFFRLGSAPLSDRKAGMFWLLANGEPARAADLLQAREAVEEAGLFNAWLDALALSKRPDAVLVALDAPNPQKDWRKALQTGRAKRLLGQSAAADAAYSQAVSLAQADPESALEAVAFLGKAGERDLFESALSRLLLDPAQAPRALQTLMPAVRGWRDTAGLRKFSDLLAAAPGLSEDQRVQLQNEIVYCDLVLGRKVAPATIESLSTKHPGDMRFQITQALALLRAGQSDLAVDELVITQAPPDDPFLLARHKAVQAMALAASGDRERARMHFENLSGDFLSPQETALARSYLKK
jgi:Flp pilus assembly protein TadD